MRGLKQEQKVVIGFEVANNDFVKDLENKTKTKESPQELLNAIVEDYEQIIKLFFNLFLESGKEGELRYQRFHSKKTKIHYEFARKFLGMNVTKPKGTPFIEWRALSPQAKRKLVDWFIENKELLNSLKEHLRKLKQKATTKISDLALIIKKMGSSEGILFVEKISSEDGIDFMDLDRQKKINLKNNIYNLARRPKGNLLKAEKIFLAKTDTGLHVFTGSLNYFSVNKKLADYEEERKKLLQKKEEKIGNRYNGDLKKFGDDFKLFKLYSSYFRGYSNLSEVKLADFKKILKDIKGQEKAKFLQGVCDIEFEDLKRRYPLFWFEGDKYGTGKSYFLKFKRYSKQIKKGRGNRNIATKRGDLINYQNGFCKTPNYAKLVKLYEKVAKELGAINARLKAIENIIDNIRKLQYWLVFVEIDKKTKLLAIPKSENLENLRQASNFLIKNNKGEGEIKILSLNSFTLKALNKLLFREDSSFRRGLSQEINGKELEEMKTRYLKSRSASAELSDTELIEFYQKVLRSNYAQKNLKFDFNKIKEVLTKKYNSVEDFRIDLEKELYCFDELYLTDEKYKEFLGKFKGIEFDIIVVDEKKNPQNRKHKDYWLAFWLDRNKVNDFPVRINPEIKFFYKEANEEVIQNLIVKYGKEKVFSPEFKNRFLKSRLIAKINFEINIPSERINFSFKERIEAEKEIEKFNVKFNRKNTDYKNAYYFGIDRGTDEFVSLGIYQTNGKKYRPEKLEAYQIKNEYLGKVVVSQSKWFDDFDTYFTKVEKNYFDLTCAKLVGDKIILNSEWQTLLELTKFHYKRKIFEVIDELADDKVGYNNENKKFFVKTTKKHKSGIVEIGYYREGFKYFRDGKVDEIKNELEHYIKTAKKSKTSPNFQLEFEKLVNYKNALAANVVGIIEFLRRKYGNVYIVMENLDTGNVLRQSTKQAQAIHRQLEWILLNKLRKGGLVPADVSKQIVFRENKTDKQLGSVLFLGEVGTSKICPNCGEQKMNYNKKEFDDFKFKKRKIKCRKCSHEFQADEVACINLAKKGFNFLANIFR